MKTFNYIVFKIPNAKFKFVKSFYLTFSKLIQNNQHVVVEFVMVII